LQTIPAKRLDERVGVKKPATNVASDPGALLHDKGEYSKQLDVGTNQSDHSVVEATGREHVG
jgi:hypothetical protein